MWVVVVVVVGGCKVQKPEQLSLNDEQAEQSRARGGACQFSKIAVVLSTYQTNSLAVS